MDEEEGYFRARLTRLSRGLTRLQVGAVVTWGSLIIRLEKEGLPGSGERLI